MALDALCAESRPGPDVAVLSSEGGGAAIDTEEKASSPQPLPLRLPDEIARADAANRAAVRAGKPGAKPAAFSFSNEVCRAGVGDAFHSETDLDAALGLNQSRGLSYIKPAKSNQQHPSLDHHHPSHAGKARYP